MIRQQLAMIKPSANQMYRIRTNWFIIGSINVLMGMTFFMETPLLHQYVTTTSSNNKNESMDEPGLNLTEDWYSAVISAGNIGGFIGAITYGLLSKYIHVRLGLIFELVMELAGGLLYALTSNGWCLTASRLLNGFFIGFHQSLMRNYAVESTDKCLLALPPIKRDQSTLKYTVLFILFCAVVFGMALGPAVTLLGGYLPHQLSRFHWPGWYISIHSVLLLLPVIFVFNSNWDTTGDIGRQSQSSDSISISSTQSQQSSSSRFLCSRMIGGLPFYILVTFTYAHLMLGWNMSILETLQNPILSDQFGLDMQKTSFILIGILGIYLVSLIILLILQRFRVDNRLILITACMIGIVGTLMMIDWQSMTNKPDPCLEHNITLDTTVIKNLNCTSTDSALDCLLDHEALSRSEADCLTGTSSDECSCEVFGSVTGNRCFWNPRSRITGVYCTSCKDVCLNMDLSLDFIQIIVGTVLLSFSYAPGRILVVTILSDMAGNRPQGWVMGLLMASGAFARATGPLWGNYMYVYTGRRTWLPMSVMLMIEVIAVIMLIIFYQKMKKRQQKMLNYDKESPSIVSSLQREDGGDCQLLLVVNDEVEKQYLEDSASV